MIIKKLKSKVRINGKPPKQQGKVPFGAKKQKPAKPDQMLVVFTLPGRPIVKKNTQRTFGRGRATRRISTPRYLKWEQDAMAGLLGHKSIALIDRPVIAVYRFYFENRMAEADVSNLCEAPGDVLQKARVLKDDALIRKVEAEKFFYETARTEVELWSIKPDAGGEA